MPPRRASPQTTAIQALGGLAEHSCPQRKGQAGGSGSWTPPERRQYRGSTDQRMLSSSIIARTNFFPQPSICWKATAGRAMYVNCATSSNAFASLPERQILMLPHWRNTGKTGMISWTGRLLPAQSQLRQQQYSRRKAKQKESVRHSMNIRGISPVQHSVLAWIAARFIASCVFISSL